MWGNVPLLVLERSALKEKTAAADRPWHAKTGDQKRRKEGVFVPGRRRGGERRFEKLPHTKLYQYSWTFEMFLQ